MEELQFVPFGDLMVHEDFGEQLFEEMCDEYPFENVFYPVPEKYIEMYELLEQQGFKRFDYMAEFINTSKMLELQGDVDDDDIHYFIPNQAFFWFCGKGDLSNAKKIYNMGDVSIRQCFKYAFCDCCEFGYFEMAQWLYYLADMEKIFGEDGVYYDDKDLLGDLTIILSDALLDSCKNKHWEITKWLYSLYNFENREMFEERKNKTLRRLGDNIVKWLKHCD